MWAGKHKKEGGNRGEAAVTIETAAKHEQRVNTKPHSIISLSSLIALLLVIGS